MYGWVVVFVPEKMYCPAYWVLPSVLTDSMIWSISAAIEAFAAGPVGRVRALNRQVARPLDQL